MVLYHNIIEIRFDVFISYIVFEPPVWGLFLNDKTGYKAFKTA